MALSIIRQACLELFDTWIKDEPQCQKEKKPGPEVVNCRNSMIGCALRKAHHLSIADLFVPKGIESYFNWSITRILEALGSISTTLDGDGHPQCNTLKPMITEVREKIMQLPTPATKWHLDYMQTQAEITNPHGL